MRTGKVTYRKVIERHSHRVRIDERAEYQTDREGQVIG